MQEVKKSESTRTVFALFKWAIILGIGASIVAGNYYYSEYSLFYRTLVALGLLIFAGVVFYTTDLGKQVFDLTLQARKEIGRVIWPSRPEMLQTFLAVSVMVTLVMIMLWGFDSLFAWLASVILG